LNCILGAKVEQFSHKGRNHPCKLSSLWKVILSLAHENPDMSSSSAAAAASGESSDGPGDLECEEIEMYEISEATYKIDSGILVAKNSEYGMYRCPFSPSRMKKQISFRHQDLVAHATRGIGRHGKNGSLIKVGNHRALEKLYLTTAEEMHQQGDKQAPDERRRLQEQVVPGRVAKEERRLCPWMGIIVNIDNRETHGQQERLIGFRLAAGAADIKEKFHVH
jgi:hypothetical protein